MEERFLLVRERIEEIGKDNILPEEYQEYFRYVSAFLGKVFDYKDRLAKGKLAETEAKELFKGLYQDTEVGVYESSYLSPSFAVEKLGSEQGAFLSALYSALRSTILWVAEEKEEFLTVYLELFVQIYGCYVAESEGEGAYEYALKEAKEVYYYFWHDYAEIFVEDNVKSLVLPNDGLYYDIIMNSDLTDLSYLYRYGKNIGKNEIEMAEYLNELSQDEINAMAKTFTEGYRIGFETTRKDISKKKTAEIRYPIGMERMVRQAILNFNEIGLKASITRSGIDTNTKNKQYEYDHKDDKALYYDKGYVERKLEVLRLAYEEVKDEARVYGGPAVIEFFGELKVKLENHKENVVMTEDQNHLNVYDQSKSSAITREFIPGDERSFTIIAFPLPTIGDNFREIFAKTMEINTLDYRLYRDIQQKIIDVLDEGVYAQVKGCNGNKTDIKVMLHPLSDKSKETIFENCVADVNIPVGEVFTSPVLEGTEGCLFVSHVYLGDYEFKNLEFHFKDGKVTDYTCSNFDTVEENKKFIFDNILFHHETLPIGEFAIGTNTTAYRAGKDYQIADKFPILIAEKTGPHFAVGDTCYSYAEDIPMYNPDGKEVVARDNSISILRKENPDKAYFNCHTDITIPFEELGEISVVTKDGDVLPIIKDGKFVVEGTQELNKPLE